MSRSYRNYDTIVTGGVIGESEMNVKSFVVEEDVEYILNEIESDVKDIIEVIKKEYDVKTALEMLEELAEKLY